MSELTESAIKKLKVNELKAELSVRGLAVKGKKDELVKRLLDALEEDKEEASDQEEEEPTESDQEEEEEEAADVDQDSEVGTSQEEAEDEGLEPAATEMEQDTTKDESPEEEVEAKEEPSVTVPDSSAGDDTETPTEAAVEDGFVILEKPSDEVAEDVEKAAESQDAVVEEQEVTEGQGETSTEAETTEAETPMEVTEGEPKEEAPKESPKEDASEVKESPRKSKSEKESKEKSGEKPSKSTDEKSGEKLSKSTDEDAEKETKKEPEIIDELAEVEEEEGEVPEEFEVGDGQVLLDSYLSDINFIITGNGVTGHNLVKNGFSLMWAGARATKGAKGGKIGYELKVVSLTKTDLPSSEAPVNAVRIGWSSENSNLQLGESSLSYGFESTGKVCASSSFFDYGEKFGEGDVIGTYLDLESEPKTLRYTKNGVDLGVAMSLTVNLEEKPLFPHVFLRNMKVELNFGGNDEPWFPTLEGYTLIQNADSENIADKTSGTPAEFSDCEVYLMVGLPSAGKTCWVKKYADAHPKQHFNILGIKYVMERTKLEGKHRKKSDPNAAKLNKAVITILTKLYHLCPKRKRNYIFDQNNVYKVAQETKMNLFPGFKRKAVVIVPTHDNLRRRTSDSKRSGGSMVEIPFGDLCDMKCEFHVPEAGDLFDEVLYPELDEKNAVKTIRDYKTDGSRAKRTGREENYPGGKRKRYDEKSSYSGGRRDNRFSGGRDSSRRDDGWKNSGSGYGGYDKNRSSGGGSGGGGYRPRDNNKPSYNDPYRRNNSGGGNRQQSYGGQSYGGNTGYGGQSYGSYGSSQSYGSGGSYGGYNNQQNRGNQYGQYGGQYGSQNQNQQWGSSGGNWGGYNRGGSSYGGSNYSY